MSFLLASLYLLCGGERSAGKRCMLGWHSIRQGQCTIHCMHTRALLCEREQGVCMCVREGAGERQRDRERKMERWRQHTRKAKKRSLYPIYFSKKRLTCKHLCEAAVHGGSVAYLRNERAHRLGVEDLWCVHNRHIVSLPLLILFLILHLRGDQEKTQPLAYVRILH